MVLVLGRRGRLSGIRVEHSQAKNFIASTGLRVMGIFIDSVPVRGIPSDESVGESASGLFLLRNAGPSGRSEGL